MKWLWTLIIVAITGGHGFGEELTFVPTDAELESLSEAYLSAFNEGDEAKLAAVSTLEFTRAVSAGGSLREKMEAMKGPLALDTIEFADVGGVPYLRMTLLDSDGKPRLSGSGWLLLKKDGPAWKVHAYVDDVE